MTRRDSRSAHVTISKGHIRGNDLTSHIEEQVRRAVIAAGYAVPAGKQAVVCRHPDDPDRTVNLTPDILLPDHKIAIEVDPLGPHEHSKAFSHTGEEGKDRLRNELLTEAGWTVIRLRLGGVRSDALGPRDVVTESRTFTRDANDALLAALDDTITKRRAKVRLVKKRKAATPARRCTPVINIGPNDRTDDGHYFNWYPDMEGPRVTMRLAVSGRYLYTHETQRFVTEVGLHLVPQDQWRDRLIDYLADRKPDSVGTTTWPWGDNFLVPGVNSADTEELLDRIHRKTEKRGIDTTIIEQTVTCDRLEHFTNRAFLTGENDVLAELHPEAFNLGYRILAVQARTGRHGKYQAILIARPPAFDPLDPSPNSDS